MLLFTEIFAKSYLIALGYAVKASALCRYLSSFLSISVRAFFVHPPLKCSRGLKYSKMAGAGNVCPGD